jgi:outer membrane protein TolC
MTRTLLLILATLAVAPGAPAQAGPAPLTLAQAIALGRERGIDAALARYNVRVAEARTGQRRADLLPSVTLNGSLARKTINLEEFGFPGVAIGVTPDFNVVNFNVQATQTVFNASAISRLRAAKDSALASGYDAQAVGDLSAATAGLAYLEVLSAEEAVAAREADSTIATDLLDQARKLTEAGVSPEIDRTRSEVNFAAVRTQLEVARNERDRARLDLAQVLELPPAQRLVLSDSLGPTTLTVPTDQEEAVAFALAHRPDMLAEQQRTKSVETSLRAIGQEYIPSLVAGAGFTESGQQFNTLDNTYVVQLGISLPLLDGWKRPKRQDEAAARLDAQKRRESHLRLQVETETRQALLDLTSAEQQVALATDRVRLAEQELSQAQQRFDAGVAGSIETTNAQSALFTARNALIQARVGYATARVRIYRALGVVDQLQ